jgi:hypothetical protein
MELRKKGPPDTPVENGDLEAYGLGYLCRENFKNDPFL